METVRFQVDAALLRELGERLVGKPHTALAELIKNAYDADASIVDLAISTDCISVADNGHGMTEDAFRSYWMRVGSPHKESQRLSPKGRPLTGQKGIGRLSTQFLGRRVSVETAAGAGASPIKATVDWDSAVQSKELTKATALLEHPRDALAFPGGSSHGTRILISGLSQSWTADLVRDVALEIWSLQPPFTATEAAERFQVRVVDADPKQLEAFTLYSQAFRTIWHAKVRGRIDPRNSRGKSSVCTIDLEFDDATRESTSVEIPDCCLHRVEFEVAIYSLTGRQPYKVSVGDLRTYLQRFGGVGIYDTGFRLPYYGVETDWLRIQMDHSRRISHSELLPKDLQVDRGLNYLPTNGRILGAVNINTGTERRLHKYENKEHPLEIALTRDRLVDNDAFRQLREAVRFGLDFYAMAEARRAYENTQKNKPIARAEDAVQLVADTVRKHAESLPPKALSDISAVVRQAVQSTAAETELAGKRFNLMGALATAGMAAASFEHEAGRQSKSLEGIAQRLETLAKSSAPTKNELTDIAKDLRRWITESQASRRIFSALADEESRQDRHRFSAKALLDDIVDRLGALTRGVPIITSECDAGVRLPSGSFVEWAAIFQNILLNAANACIESDRKAIHVSTKRRGASQVVLIQDTGVGVDIESSEELFEPFHRRLQLKPSHRGLGVGGSGLGLTIVKMIAHNLGCRVAFVPPGKGFSTAFCVSWTEKS